MIVTASQGKMIEQEVDKAVKTHAKSINKDNSSKIFVFRRYKGDTLWSVKLCNRCDRPTLVHADPWGDRCLITDKPATQNIIAEYIEQFESHKKLKQIVVRLMQDEDDTPPSRSDNSCSSHNSRNNNTYNLHDYEESEDEYEGDYEDESEDENEDESEDEANKSHEVDIPEDNLHYPEDRYYTYNLETNLNLHNYEESEEEYEDEDEESEVEYEEEDVNEVVTEESCNRFYQVYDYISQNPSEKKHEDWMLRLHPDDLKRHLESEKKYGRFKPRNLTKSDWLAEELMFPTDSDKKQERQKPKEQQSVWEQPSAATAAVGAMSGCQQQQQQQQPQSVYEQQSTIKQTEQQQEKEQLIQEQHQLSATAADAVDAVSSCQQQQPHPVQEQHPQQTQQSIHKQPQQQYWQEQLEQEQQPVHEQPEQQQQQPQSVHEQSVQQQQQEQSVCEQQQSKHEQSEQQKQQQLIHELQQHLLEQQTQTVQKGQQQQLNICPAQPHITLLQKNSQKPPPRIKNNPRSKRRHRAKIKETISEKRETYQLKDDPRLNRTIQVDKPILDSDLSLMKNNPGSNRIRQVDIPDEKFLLTEEKSEVEDYVSIKARSVIRGDQDETEDDIPCNSLTVDSNTMKLLIAIAAIMGWPLRSVDISAAFSQGKDIIGLHGLKETTRLWFENQDQSQHPEKLTEVHRDAEKATKDKKKTTLRGVVDKLPTRPDLSLRTNILSRIPAGTNLDEKIKEAREPVEEARRKPPEIKDEKIGSLENSSLEMYADASFGGVEKGIQNTEGLIILLREDDSRCAPIAWRSQVVSRVGRSVKTDETVALEDALNRATGIGRQVIQNQTGKTQEIPIPVRACIDSNSLVESLKQQLVTETEWVPTHLQRTDPLTKAKADTTALIRILKSGFLRRPG